MSLLPLPQTVRLRYLWLSRFPRLNQSVPAQISHHRLVCQACVPLSPLCLPYSPFVSSSVSLLLPAAAAWLGFLFSSTAESSWVLLFWKECESVWLLKTLSGDLGGQSPKIWFWTSFGPRSHLVRTPLKIAASQNPARRGFGKALQWFATWSAAAAVVACAAASGQGAFFGQRTKNLWKGWKLRGRNQKHQKMTWKKKVAPISGVPWGSGWKGWLAWSWIHHRNHRTATSITSKFVCWKCHETWCAMRRMIVLTVQTGGRLLMSGVSGVCHAAGASSSKCRWITPGLVPKSNESMSGVDKKTGRVLQNWLLFSFRWKAAVLLSMRVCPLSTWFYHQRRWY